MSKQRITALLALLAALAMPAAPLYAQARSNVQGTIDSVMLDEHYIIINGERLTLREDELVVTWNGRQLRASLMSAGMTVFYSTRDDGSIRSITLIGPADELQKIDQH